MSNSKMHARNQCLFKAVPGLQPCDVHLLWSKANLPTTAVLPSARPLFLRWFQSLPLALATIPDVDSLGRSICGRVTSTSLDSS